MASQAIPATDLRLAKLLAGEPLIFPPRPANPQAEPDQFEQLRCIPANWLQLLRKDAVVSVPITISGALSSARRN